MRDLVIIWLGVITFAYGYFFVKYYWEATKALKVLNDVNEAQLKRIKLLERRIKSLEEHDEKPRNRKHKT